MRTELINACKRFIENRDAFRASSSFEPMMIYPVCAGVLQAKKRTVTAEEIKECKKMLKENTGVFSNFRGNVKLPIIAMLLSEPDYERKFQNITEAYSVLKKHFFASQGLTLAAFVMAEVSTPLRYEETAQRAKNIYDFIKKKHPFLTNGDDSAFCVMMTLSKKSDEEIAADVEECYKTLKKEFLSSNSVQGLSFILALCEEVPCSEKCERAKEIYSALRERKVKFSASTYLPVIGAAAISDKPVDLIADDVKEVFDFLKTQKGYGLFGADKASAAMHSVMIVNAEIAEENIGSEIASVVATVAVIAAQQAAMTASVAAASASASN